MSNLEFSAFPKIPRLSREMVVTEKLDGTNAVIDIRKPSNAINLFEFGYDCQIQIDAEEYLIRAGSKNRWLQPTKSNDNHGFAHWVYDFAHDLGPALGPGRHHGEWWGKGIQRGYGLNEKRFSLFNTSKWAIPPAHCHVVPVLYTGPFDTASINGALIMLGAAGSVAAPGFMKPEGVVVFHTQGNFMLKKTLEHDEAGKGT